MKVRVPVAGTIGRAVDVPRHAADGATVGVNLRWPDGALVKESDLRDPAGTGGGSAGTGARPIPWKLVLEVPANVQAVAALAGAGLVTRRANGDWTVRAIVSSDGSIAITSPDGGAGNVDLVLPDVPDSGLGALLAIQRDAKGRVTGTRAPTTDDLPEGVTNRYQHDYLHTQGTAADTWSVAHNLGHEPIVAVRTQGGADIEAAVTHLSANNLVINLSAPLAGFARCI